MARLTVAEEFELETLNLVEAHLDHSPMAASPFKLDERNARRRDELLAKKAWVSTEWKGLLDLKTAPQP